MKTWSVLYGLIWAAFFQIFIVVVLLAIVPSSGVWYDATIGIHVVIGIIVIALAMFAFRLVKQTTCPDRIKRISKTTATLAGVQAILGVILEAMIMFNVSTIAQDIVLLFHVGLALTIIAQASSSATAFDMWEEKEFATPSVAAAPS